MTYPNRDLRPSVTSAAKARAAGCRTDTGREARTARRHAGWPTARCRWRGLISPLPVTRNVGPHVLYTTAVRCCWRLQVHVLPGWCTWTLTDLAPQPRYERRAPAESTSRASAETARHCGVSLFSAGATARRFSWSLPSWRVIDHSRHAPVRRHHHSPQSRMTTPQGVVRT